MSEPKTPPLPRHNTEAERGVLGAILRTPTLIGELANIVRPDDFYIFGHKRLYQAMLDIYQDGKPIDVVTVANLIHERKEVEDTGGYQYFFTLWDSSPSAASVNAYASIVRDDALTRDIERYGSDVARKAGNPSGPPQELLEEAETELYRIAQHRPANETVGLPQAVAESVDRLDTRTKRRNAVNGIPSGWKRLDDLTGGFQAGELIILGARPSVGKTAFVCNILRHLSRENIPWLFFSLEQARVEIIDRLLCLEGRIDSHRVRTGWVSEQERVNFHQAGYGVADKPGWINDRASMGMVQIMAESRRCQNRFGVKVVFVDYLQLIATDRGHNRNDQIGEISRRLKILARELGLPVVCLSQLNREVEKRAGRPKLSDLRDSGNIEQDADTVIFLHRPDETTNIREVVVAKQRNGPIGDVQMVFTKDYMEFGVLAQSDDDTPQVPQQWK